VVVVDGGQTGAVKGPNRGEKKKSRAPRCGCFGQRRQWVDSGGRWRESGRAGLRPQLKPTGGRTKKKKKKGNEERKRKEKEKKKKQSKQIALEGERENEERGFS